MDTKQKTRVAYVKPVLSRIGSFEDITQGTATGSHFDSTHITGSPAQHNIFS
jgi:hypothetical protein